MTSFLLKSTLMAIMTASTITAFSVTKRRKATTSSARRFALPRLFATNSANSFGSRKGRTIPLLDLSDSDEHAADAVVTPLPSAHLPDELTTLFLYGMELTRPVHKMLIEDATTASIVGSSSEEQGQPDQGRIYGYIAEKSSSQGGDEHDDTSLVGAVGCAVEILVSAQPAEKAHPNSSEVGDDAPIVVLCKGTYRFVVKHVVKTFPYPVAIVDELLDEESPSTEFESMVASGNDEEEEDDGIYSNLGASELVRRIMMGLKTLIEQKLDDKRPQLTPLEESILEAEAGVAFAAQQIEEEQAEEMAAVFDIFQSSLLDIAPTSVERYYAVAILAAEIAKVDNDVRKELLVMTNGVARMRVVLEEIDKAVSLNQARKVADTITNEVDEDKKDLKVGTPQLPAWVRGIKDGTRIEYFWSEQDGWCGGVVDGDPMKIVDELIVTVRFDDGETHRLPITPHEKVRWRPPEPPSS